MLTEYLAATLVTLMVVVDPPALAPIFIGVTQGMSEDEKRRVAMRASIIAALVLAFFGLIGAKFLGVLGISIPAFRIAGGVLLFWISFEMVFEQRNRRKSAVIHTAIDEDHIRNVAAFPLAIPLMAGPGAITATILLAAQAQDAVQMAGLMATIALVMFASLIVCRMATRIAGWLGITGNIVVTRLLGVILAAMAVQFIIDGIKAAFRLV